VFAVYGTSSYDDEDFFLALRAATLETDNTDVIIVGDLNTTLSRDLDQEGYSTDPHWRSRSVINEWIEVGDYTDAYRSVNPDTKGRTWRKPHHTLAARLDYILLSNSLSTKLQSCRIVFTPPSISDHHGCQATIILDKSPTGPGTFRAAPHIEADFGYQQSVKYLIQDEMISLSNITKKEKDEARKQNFEIFEISKDQNLTKEGRSLILAEKKSQMISKETLLRAGLSISTNTALDFVVFKVGCATKLYQRNLKSLEKDCLEDIQEKMESLLETDPDNLEDLKSLEEEQEAILIHICKARNLQDPPR
jgi:hypothetical protein